jgi:hypothetical protein
MREGLRRLEQVIRSRDFTALHETPLRKQMRGN